MNRYNSYHTLYYKYKKLTLVSVSVYIYAHVHMYIKLHVDFQIFGLLNTKADDVDLLHTIRCNITTARNMSRIDINFLS